MQVLSPWIRQQFFDANGQALSGGKIVFNVVGSTSQYKNTYQDALGATLNTNPVVLDSSGVARIYGTGLYDVYIYDAYDELVESISSVDFGGASASGIGTSIIVANYDALRNLSTDYDIVYVLGRTTTSDGGEGIFEHDINSTVADDDGITLVRGASSHYIRALADYVDPVWYGVVYDSQIDQSSALLASLTGGTTYNLPVIVSGRVYLGSKTTISQGTIEVTGSLVGLSAIELRFKQGCKFVGSLNALGNNINPVFEQGVCDALYLSWFTDGTDGSRWTKLAASTVYGYNAIMDINTSISTDIVLPANISLDVIGGSKCTITGKANIIINSFIYTGKGEIFHYNDASYIGTVKLGDSYCYLEWFGGIADSSLYTDNSIAFKAAINHGSIYLVSEAGNYYNIPAGTYTATAGINIYGNIPAKSCKDSINASKSSTLVMQGVVLSASDFTISNAKIQGYGSINASGSLIVDNAQIADTIAYDTGMTNIADTLAINPQYILVGNAGKIYESSDATTWVSKSIAISSPFNSIARNNKTYVAVANNGYIYTSTDGTTWTLVTSGTTSNIYKVIYQNGKFVAVGAGGLVLYSTNGTQWNSTVVGANDLKGVSWSTVASSWIVVGAVGAIYVSADLLTWNHRVISNYTGTINDVYSNASVTTLVGYNGTIYTSTDFNTFTSRYSGATSSLLSIAYYTDKKVWIATSANGKIYKSLDAVNYVESLTHLAFSDAIYGQIELNGKYLFACGSGYLLATYDFNTYSQTQPLSNATNNYAICGLNGGVIAVGAGGVIKATNDMVNWTSVTSGTTYDLHRANLVNGVYYVLGSHGTYLTSYEGATWTVRSIGATNDIYDLTCNADNSLFVAVCSGGAIYTSTNPIADNVVWTSRTSNTTNDLTYLLYMASTWYAYGKSATILKSTDGINWTNINNATTNQSNGVISNGANGVVYFGAGGAIRSTVDGVTYVTRTSGTTNNLLDGIYAGGKYVIVGAGGVILTSADGIAWTSMTSGTSAQLNKIQYINSKYLVVGSSGTIRQSTDAITWSSAVSSIKNTVGDSVTISVGFLGIGYITGYYYAFGEVGCKICYSSNLSNWIIYDPTNNTTDDSEPITVPLYDCYSQGKTAVIFGAGGYIYTIYADGIDEAKALPVDNSNNWKRVVGNIVIGDNGACASIFVANVAYACPFVNPLVTNTTDNLIDGYVIGSNYTIISSTNTYTSPNTVVWTKQSSVLTGDILAIWPVGNTVYLIAGGKLYSTTDNISFNYIKDTTATNIEYIAGTYYLVGMTGASTIIETATTPSKTGFSVVMLNSDPYSIKAIGTIAINGSTYYYYQSSTKVLVGGLPMLSITVAGSANVSDSLLDAKIVNGKYGNVSNSILSDIAMVGKLEDSTLNSMTGDIYDNAARSYIYAASDVGIANNVALSECSLVQTKVDTQLFNIADTVTALTLNNCNTVLTSMLGYSINTGLSIVLDGGFLTTNYALSNGYAKVYLNSVFDANGALIIKPSAYCNNGQVFNPYKLADTLSIITKDSMHHPQLANLSNGTNVINVTADVAISSNINSAYTLRYRDGGHYFAYDDYVASGITYGGTANTSVFTQLPDPHGNKGTYYNCTEDGIAHWNVGITSYGLNVNKGDLIISTGPKVDSNNNDVSAYVLMKNTSPMRNLYLKGGKIVLTLTLPAGYDKDKQKLIQLIPQLHVPNYITYRQYDIRHVYRQANVWEAKRGNVDATSCIIDGANIITTAYVSYPIGSEHVINPITGAQSNGSDDGNIYWDIYGDNIVGFPTESVNSVNVYISPIMGVSNAFTDYAAYITIIAKDECVIPAGSTIKMDIVPCANQQMTDGWFQYLSYRIGTTEYLI